MTAQTAIARLRRDLTVSRLIRWLLISLALAALLFDVVVQRKDALPGPLLLAAIAGIWLVLSYRSVKGSRIAAASPALIASGDFETAEQRIDAALRSFSLFQGVKLRSLHQLALLRHAQERWGESALLCEALLRQPAGPMAGISRSTLLILADSLLRIGDLEGASQAILGLYSYRLPLSEALDLALIQLDYLAQVGAWEQMLQAVDRRVQLAELMTAEHSAATQGLLALAARKTARTQLELWLRGRCELLAEPVELTSRRPILAELWPAV